MRRMARPAVVILVLITAGQVSAFTFGPMSVMARTRGGQVEWQPNVTIETSSLAVRGNEFVVGSQRIDVQPDGVQAVRVHVEQWNMDIKRFVITMLAGQRTGLNVTYSNPGYNLTVFQAGFPTHTCAATVDPCAWAFQNGTRFNLTIATPAGAQQLSSGGDLPALPAPGGGGGASSQPEGPRGAPGLIPNPVELFPRFTAARWFALLVCGILAINGTERVRRILPKPLQLRGERLREAYLFGGTAGLVATYFAPI